MEIAVIRHLPTSWNHKGYLQGKRDISVSFPLSEQIRGKIQQNRELLSEREPFDGIFASALKRTQQTALLYGYRTPVITSLLNELDFGWYEGKPKKSLDTDFQAIWRREPLRLEFGESLIDFQQRIFQFVESYIHLRNILIFGHGSWIRALLSLEKTGNINNMNELSVDNNECVFLSIDKEQIDCWKNGGQR